MNDKKPKRKIATYTEAGRDTRLERLLAPASGACQDDSCDATHCPQCGGHKADWYALGLCQECQEANAALTPLEKLVERAAGGPAARPASVFKPEAVERVMGKLGRRALQDFVDTINATGGVVQTAGSLHVGCAVDPDWGDLAQAYLLACQALGVPPVITRQAL